MLDSREGNVRGAFDPPELANQKKAGILLRGGTRLFITWGLIPILVKTRSQQLRGEPGSSLRRLSPKLAKTQA